MKTAKDTFPKYLGHTTRYGREIQSMPYNDKMLNVKILVLESLKSADLIKTEYC